MKMAKKSEDTTEFDVHYVKSNDFKTCLSTGAIGGVTPNGLIDINFFVDRNPIPKKITYKIENGKLGSDIETEGKEGSIREVTTGIIMDLNTAKSLINWLDEKIKIIEGQPVNKK